ncbi:adaptor protein MecA [Sporosarcina cyprini]|uniref:adaptor protein MecA n=1 Tax=Sporosarcina cyprini TaxID=2910523 RepID=UPI001EDF9A3F|nr:adaptor protein MecA [Sporosarcina cyprini]MCG3089658.1 adaptor protein MecA [Sporosarcina cyprini]
MEIERINENTVKFYLSYIDIEERGFTREEVWYNRDKSEELFWEMMDEINDETEFEIEGPLWIQVHAMNNGIEVTVTRAQMPADGDDMEMPFGMDDPRKMFQEDSAIFGKADTLPDEVNDEPEEWTSDMFVFTDFEELISMSRELSNYTVHTSLYQFEEKYYLYVEYDEDSDDARKTDFCSVMTEHGALSNVTIHRLEEYGHVIMESDVFETIQTYFG